MGKNNIYHISKITGFSPSTVSRALSGTGYCSEKTRAIIKKAADDMGFYPSTVARTMRSRRTNRILFCIPDICNPFYFDMIKGANDVFQKHGIYVMLCYTHRSLQEELNAIELLMGRFGDGMIFVSFNFNEENVSAIRRCGYPVVTTNPYESKEAPNNFDCVYVDHIRAMRLATDHLIQQGHKNIAMVVGPLTEQTGSERAQGYREAMTQAGLEVKKENIFVGDYTKASGEKASLGILDSKQRITGVVCANDLMAMGVMAACSSRGVKIPEDLALVSLDNTDYATSVHPQLTSVDMMQYAIGENAATLLLERMEEKRKYVKNIRLEPRLIVRTSSVGTKL